MNRENTIDDTLVAHSVNCWLPLTMTWLYHQVKNISGYQSIVLANTSQNLNQFPWEPIYSITNPISLFIFKLLREFNLRQYPLIHEKAIREHHPHILHSHFGDQGWRNITLAQKYSLKHVVTFYGQDISWLPASRPVWKTRYKQLFNTADVFLWEGSHMAKSAIELGCPETKVHVHHLGINVDTIHFSPRTWSRTEPLKVLIAGTFREKKGIPYAIEALGRLQNDISLEITIIGDADHEQKTQLEKTKIIKSVNKHNLNENVKFLGYQPYDAFLEEASRHHIFVSPSVTANDGDTEGGAPVAMIELAASGMPIISTNHCDIPEVLNYGRDDLLAKERDVNDLVRVLTWWIENTADWQSLLETQRKHITLEYNGTIQGRKLSNIYQKI